MDNQKSNEAKGSTIGTQGSSLGKDNNVSNLGKDSGNSQSSVSGSGNLGSTSGSGSMSKSTPLNQGKDQQVGMGSSTGGATASSIGSTGSQNSQSANSVTGSGTGGDSKDLGSQVDAKAQDLHQSIDKAADAAKPYVDKAVNSVQPVVERLATSAHAGVDKLQGMLSGATSGLGERQAQLTDAYGKWKDASFDYVREKPATALAIAAAAGFVLAKLLGGSRRDY